MVYLIFMNIGLICILGSLVMFYFNSIFNKLVWLVKTSNSSNETTRIIPLSITVTSCRCVKVWLDLDFQKNTGMEFDFIPYFTTFLCLLTVIL